VGRTAGWSAVPALSVGPKVAGSGQVEEVRPAGGVTALLVARPRGLTRAAARADREQAPAAVHGQVGEPVRSRLDPPAGPLRDVDEDLRAEVDVLVVDPQPSAARDR